MRATRLNAAAYTPQSTYDSAPPTPTLPQREPSQIPLPSPHSPSPSEDSSKPSRICRTYRSLHMRYAFHHIPQLQPNRHFFHGVPILDSSASPALHLHPIYNSPSKTNSRRRHRDYPQQINQPNPSSQPCILDGAQAKLQKHQRSIRKESQSLGRLIG